MSTNVLDLWGDLELKVIRTPRLVLREQASLLRNKTKGLVQAAVESIRMGEDFHVAFNLVAPSLENYAYRLFTISHGIGLYPVRVLNGPEIKSEQAFLNWLKEQLSSQETRRVIESLVSQATS